MITSKTREAFLFTILQDDRETLGYIEADIDGKHFEAKTLELPWHQNDPGISCIPAGRWPCKKTFSPAHGDIQYEIMVPGRSGLRFDIVNFVRQLKGCVGLGTTFEDLNSDGITDVAGSKNKVIEFRAYFGDEDFWLIVDRTVKAPSV